MLNLLYVSGSSRMFVGPDGKFRCHICGNAYKYGSGLSRHLEACGREKNQLCPYCPHKAYRRDNMLKHVRMVHKVNHYFDQKLDDVPFSIL